MRTFIATCLAVGAISNSLVRAGTFVLDVRDEAGQPLPCRVLIRPRDRECIVPSNATELRIGSDRWFMSGGHVQLEIPSGACHLRVERGLEYVRLNEKLTIPETVLSKTIVLRRWVNMQERGFLCGESHLHLDVASLGPMLACEGLDFGTSLSWWNGPDSRRPPPPGPDAVRTLRFAGRQIPASVFDAELEHGWGAVYLQNLPEPLPLASDPHRPNLDYVRYAAASGGTVHYQAGWSREVGVDALMGYVHTVNVCNNNFHLHRFQPRSRYSNLLEVQGLPIYPDTDEGMMRLNMDSYYRLLNWGLRLAAGAGSATGVKQLPAGYNRAYVHVPKEASLAEFNRTWREGRNFVTNGPMLFLETAEGRGPGDTIDLPFEGGPVRLHVAALSDQVLTSVEVIRHGTVVASFPVDNAHKVAGEIELNVNGACWLAARCTARDDLLSDRELSAYANGDRQQPSRLRFAHTSPIYVTVKGRSAAVRKSIQEGLAMLDRFEVYARDTAGAEHLAVTLEAVEHCRSELQSRLQHAE